MVPAYRDIFEVGNDPMDGLGVEEIPETTVYGECDFTAPPRVRQVQTELGVPVTGFWDEETCAAWREKLGRNPTPEDLERAFFKGAASCAHAVVPVCGGDEAPKLFTTGRIAVIGLVVTGVFVVGYMAARRRR